MDNNFQVIIFYAIVHIRCKKITKGIEWYLTWRKNVSILKQFLRANTKHKSTDVIELAKIATFTDRLTETIKAWKSPICVENDAVCAIPFIYPYQNEISFAALKEENVSIK
jgi:hypothetical protein